MSEQEPGSHDATALTDWEERRWTVMIDNFPLSEAPEVRYALQSPNRIRRIRESVASLPRKAMAALGILAVGVVAVGVVPNETPRLPRRPIPQVSYEPSPEVSELIVRSNAPTDGSVENHSGPRVVSGDA